MSGETIEAAIKCINFHDVNSQELQELLVEYHRLNGNKVPRVGEGVKIPILLRHENDLKCQESQIKSTHNEHLRIVGTPRRSS
jgi:hypothetical protein